MAEINAPQPNFNAAAQGLQIAATELRNCTNLPAIRDGVTILEAIRHMEEHLTQRIQNLEVSFTLRSLAMENNSVSRLQNRMLHSPNEPLAPLYDMQNVIVDGFPQTSGEIDRLRVQDLDGIFQSLGVHGDGLIGQKKQRLRVLAGLRIDMA